MRSAESIALIGIGCRFPGASGPEAFWQLLRSGVDAITEVPPDRFDIDAYYDRRPSAKGKIACRCGGFLDRVDLFEPGFFGISPREAAFMDPQHRLLLETAWEALEDAAVVPAHRPDAPVGGFVGLSFNDYEDMLFRRPQALNLRVTAGGSRFSAAGRISHCLNLRGPSLVVDTACSSSLVAVHLACRSLRAGECRLALAGGVNLILQPHVNICLSHGNVLAPDGRCKFGDARADGYGRSEGVGLVVLKCLSDALADGDAIYAVIRGDAFNHNGATEAGLVTPSRPAIEAVMRQAYSEAGVRPQDVHYVEAHGTGTSAGDLAEIPAISTVMGEGRTKANPCLLGSVKTNIGHAESAAGIAGLIKAALCLHHQMIPPSLHFHRPHPDIAWRDLPLIVQTELTPWPVARGPRFAGINSFGISGTNAHVVLEQAPPVLRAGHAGSGGERLLCLSARSKSSLQELSGRYAQYLEERSDVAVSDVCFLAAVGRTHFEHRLALVARSNEHAAEQLRAFAAGAPAVGLLHGHVPRAESVRRTAPPSGDSGAIETRARAYVEGADPETPDNDRARPRLSLPTYPFERRRYWIDGSEVTGPQDLKDVELENLLYQIRWEPQAAPQREAGANNSTDEMFIYRDLLPEMDDLCVSYVWTALRSLGLGLRVGDRFRTDELALRAGVVPAHRRLFAWLMDRLARVGVLERAGPGWRVSREPPNHDPQGQCARLMAAYAPCRAELELLSRCGSRLAKVLRGECDPLDLLFPDGLPSLLERIYQEAPFSRAGNRWLRDALQDALRAGGALSHIAPNRPIRVLEVGAGTGAATAGIIDLLPAERTEYVFTDVSSLFLTHARRKFSAHPFMRYERLDIECDPVKQGFGDRHFDVILAANVLHATADLRRTLAHVRRLLAPGGMLLQLEVTSRLWWADLTFGLTEGWWKFSDRDLRPDYPLLNTAQWTRVLAETGFADPAGRDDGPDGHFGQSLLTARASSEASAPIRVRQSRWLLLSDRSGVGSSLAEGLRASGVDCATAYAGSSFERVEPGIWQLDPSRPEDVDRLLADVSCEDLRGIVHLWSLDSPPAETLSGSDLEVFQRRVCGSCIHLVQALGKREGSPRPRLWLVTRGAQAVVESDLVAGLPQSALWGLGRVLSLEHPELWGSLIDLEAGADGEDSSQCVMESLGSGAIGSTGSSPGARSSGKDQMAWRGGVVHAARLPRGVDLGSATAPVRLRSEGTYLVTGGLGGLGGEVLRWLVRGGARDVVVMGRRGASPDSRALVRELEGSGARVHVRQGDVSRAEDLTRIVKEIRTHLPPLRGVMHLAGVTRFESLDDMKCEELETVLRPKVLGAWNLHRAVSGIDLDFFVLFSSAAAVWGSRHMGHYAAANCFLDALAHYRRGLRLPALSINWGRLSRRGMQSSQLESSLARIGVKAIPMNQGLEALGRLMQSPHAQVTVAAVDWQTFKPIYELRGPRPFLERIDAAQEAPTAAASATSAALRARLDPAAPNERKVILRDYIDRELAAILGFAGDQTIDPHKGFFTLGMDSLSAVEFRNRLQKNLATELPSALLFECSTVQTLADHLADRLFTSGIASTPSRARRADRAERSLTNQAVEGMSLEELEAALEEELQAVEALLETYSFERSSD